MYSSKWGGNNGFSLERISLEKESSDSSNWTTSLSVNRGTPAAENSVTNIPDYPSRALIINEIMFDPDIDNSEFISL